MGLNEIYDLADDLYLKGYRARQAGKDYDPRGCQEWQAVVDALTAKAKVVAWMRSDSAIQDSYWGKYGAIRAFEDDIPLCVAAPYSTQVCPCGDRPANQCDEEWGPKCDLGNNEKHCRVATPQPVVLKQR